MMPPSCSHISSRALYYWPLSLYTQPQYIGNMSARGSIIIRNLATAANEAAVKPFEAIPSPPGGWLPIFGHLPAMIKEPAGFGKSWQNIRNLKEKYLAKDDKIMRMNMPLFNPINGRVLLLFDPADCELAYRLEGKHPWR